MPGGGRGILRGLAGRVHGTLSVTELLVLVALLLWSVVPLGWILNHHLDVGGHWVGADGKAPYDQLLYLGWIRDAADHVLVANRYDTRQSAHVYLHPVFAPSGLAVRAGLTPTVALLAWKPVAVIALFAGFVAYVRRMVPGSSSRRAVVLWLALFFVTPVLPLVVWGDLARQPDMLLIGDVLSPAMRSWGYPMGALAVGLLPLALLCVERIVEPAQRARGRGRAWYIGWSCGLAFLISWLHPWQGQTLILVLAGVAAWARFDRGLVRVLAMPVAAALLPLVYYLVLSRADDDWIVARDNSAIEPLIVSALLALAPLAIVAAAGARFRVDSVQERMMLLWPVTVLACYVALSPQWPFNALMGVSLPLAILAARAMERFRAPPALALALVALATLPGQAHFVDEVRSNVRDASDQFFVGAPERAALDYLADSPVPGGVLTDLTLGRAVPQATGRQAWIGHETWTPDLVERVRLVDELLAGRLRGPAALDLVRRSRVAFVIARCNSSGELADTLRPLVRDVRRFGCVTVYGVRDEPAA